MKKGWIKIHRQFIDNDVWRNDPTAWRIFEALLALCDERGQWSGGRWQLSNIARIKDGTTYKALKRLQKCRMVNIASNNEYSVINILNWSKYQHPVTAPVTTKSQRSNTLIRIENKNSNINITKTEVYGSPIINAMFDYWKESTGLEITSRVKANRNAANNLIKKHGEDKVRQLIDGVVLAQDDQYAPRIADFTDLQTKLNALLVWGKQRKKAKGINIA